MSGRSLLPRLRDDRRGATLVEFAMILPALCMVLVGTFELGYRSYAASVIQGALHEAARMATVGGVTMDEIDARVKARLGSFAHQATVTTETSSYYDFSGVRRPEKITSDTAPLGEYNAGDCFEDANGNGSYDLDRGRSGLGGADDIVNYTVTFSYEPMFPVGGILGWDDNYTISASTALRNQPYAGRSISTVTICTPAS